MSRETLNAKSLMQALISTQLQPFPKLQLP